jgi:hypothetical protein
VTLSQVQTAYLAFGGELNCWKRANRCFGPKAEVVHGLMG